MKKVILILGVLFAFVPGTKATSELDKTLILMNKCGFNNINDLSERLAADADFRKFYSDNVDFANKLLQSGSGNLFLHYMEKTILPDELTQLLNNLNLEGKNDLDNVGQKFKKMALLFIDKFPDLRQMPEEKRKTTLFNAFKIRSLEKSIVTKSQNIRNVTPEECFWWWMTCNTACLISCSAAENNNCYWECWTTCGALYGLCWLLSE